MNKLIEIFNTKAKGGIEYCPVENDEFSYLLRNPNNGFRSILLYNPHSKTLYLRAQFNSEFNKMKKSQNDEFISFLENKFKMEIRNINNMNSDGLLI